MHVTSRLRSGEATRHIGAIRHVTISDLTSTDPKPPAMYPFRPQSLWERQNHPSTMLPCRTCQLSRLAVGLKPAKWTPPESRGHPHKAFAYAPRRGVVC